MQFSNTQERNRCHAGAEIKFEVGHPDSGFRAFYLELTYPDPVEGSYSKCTRMFVAGKYKLFLK